MIAELLLATTLLSSSRPAQVAHARKYALLKSHALLLPDVVVTSPPKTTGGGGGGVSSSGTNTWTADQTFNDDVDAIFGTGADGNIVYDTQQTPDTLRIGVGQDSRILLIAEKADAFDFAHAQQTHPTVCLHSANQSTTQYGCLAHDASNFVISTGAGGVLFPAGTASLPGIGWSADADGTGTGFYRSAANAVDVTISGGQSFQFNGSYFGVGLPDRRASTADIWWSTAGFGSGSVDLILEREGAAILQQGDDVNGAAVAQTIKAHDGITGTDIAGANLTIAGGRGTGAGAGGNVILSASPALATGTTAQTLTARETIVAKARTLTTDTATTVFTVTGLGAHIRTGGLWAFTVEAGDGTNDQIATCEVRWSAIDTTAGAGGETCTVFLHDTCTAALSGAASSGTLAVTTDTTTGTDTCNYRLTATSSLTETVLQSTYIVFKNGVGTVNPQ